MTHQLTAIRTDIWYALRALRRSPVFALTATLSIAVGIGATTAVFTVANTLFFRPPVGVSHPDRLVDVVGTRGGRLDTLSFPAYARIRDQASALESVYGYQMVATPVTLDAGRGIERALGALVTPNYFSALGSRPALGRLLDTDRPGTATTGPAVVLNHAFWVSRFNRDPHVVGRALPINGQPLTIAGVASPGFHGTTIMTADLWISLSAAATVTGNPSALTETGGGFLMTGGRLRAGASIAAATSELNALGRTLSREFPDPDGELGLRAAPLAAIPGNVGAVAGFTALMMGLVGTVLLAACVNLTSVLIARATVRRREIGIRLAMGARAVHVLRQLLAEALVVFGLGAVAGVALARALTVLLLTLVPALPIPVDLALPLDGRVLAFAAIVALLAALGSSLAPAWDLAGTDVILALRAMPGSPAHVALRRMLVAGQMAFGTVLIVGAGLLIRALDRAVSVDPGFDPHRVETATLELPQGRGAAEVRVLVRDLLAGVSRLPGVEATVASAAPFDDAIQRLAGLTVPGVPAPANRRGWDALGYSVDSGYFAALRIPVVSGRAFTAADRDGAPRVAIVSRSTARRFWPRQSAIGQSLRYQTGASVEAVTGPDRARTAIVVGVVGDVRLTSLAEDGSRLVVYLPLQQELPSRLTLIVRGREDRPLGAQLTTLAAAAAPTLPPPLARRLEDRLAVSLAPQRIAATISGFSGIIGLLLASIGLYGLAAFVVAQRTREFGVRMALGARRVHIAQLVLREAVLPAATGSGAGVVLTALLSRMLGRLLFGVPPLDVVAFGVALLVLSTVTLLATVVPTRRAAAVDPVEALRAE